MTLTKAEAVARKYTEVRERLGEILPGADTLFPSLEEVDLADLVSLVACTFMFQSPEDVVRGMLIAHGLHATNNQFYEIMKVVTDLLDWYRAIV